MKLPISWLKKFIDVNIDVRDLSEKLTFSGSHVESISCVNEYAARIVTGKIIRISGHPNADKLKCLTVDTGSEKIDLVTGAPNIFEGAIVGIALSGARLSKDKYIEASDFRGVISNGMLLSYSELGFEDSVIPKQFRDGVIIFSDDTPIGLNLIDLLNLRDPIIEFEITPNRPDCLSIEGMARETAAVYNTVISAKSDFEAEQDNEIEEFIDDISIESPGCIRYFARAVKNVRIKPSPLWLQNALMLSGVRPINNIVDITNYVMLELGNPLHAFDLDMIKNKKIVVKQAREGYEFTTLDGVNRKLSKDDMMITDGVSMLAIAGIMGGENSEVSCETKTILIEGASFDQAYIRRSSKNLGLRTESSSRFEKGLSNVLCKRAVERTVELVKALDAGEPVKGFIDRNLSPEQPLKVEMRYDRVNQILGTDLTKSEMNRYLELLEFTIEDAGDSAVVEVPYFRKDVCREIDLIEEVGRIYGFHKIERKPLTLSVTRGTKPYHSIIAERIKRVLQGLNYNEIMTYSFIGPKDFDKLMISEDSDLRNAVKILNPLGEDYSIMRTLLSPSVLEVMSLNFARKVSSCRAYEIGNIFKLESNDAGAGVRELKHICVGFYGEEDFYHLKETICLFLNRIGINKVSFEAEKSIPTFHPGRCARVYANNRPIGYIGEIHPYVCENYGIKQKAYLTELDFDSIVEMSNLERKFKALPKYPAVERDLAIIVDEALEVGSIKSLVVKEAGGLLENFRIFDIYRGSPVEKDKKSVAFAIRLRSHTGTLKEVEINDIMKKVMDSLRNKFGAIIRE